MPTAGEVGSMARTDGSRPRGVRARRGADGLGFPADRIDSPGVLVRIPADAPSRYLADAPSRYLADVLSSPSCDRFPRFSSIEPSTTQSSIADADAFVYDRDLASRTRRGSKPRQ